MEASDMLGVTEKYVLNKFQDELSALKKKCTKISEILEDINLSGGTELMLDTEGKEMIMSTLTILESLNEGLAPAVLIIQMVKMAFEPEG